MYHSDREQKTNNQFTSVSNKNKEGKACYNIFLVYPKRLGTILYLFTTVILIKFLNTHNMGLEFLFPGR